MKLRQRFKEVYEERHGVKLTVTPFVVRAVVPALRAFHAKCNDVPGPLISLKARVEPPACAPLSNLTATPMSRVFGVAFLHSDVSNSIARSHQCVV